MIDDDDVQRYSVHLYALVRVKLIGVLAESQTAAIDAAVEAVRFNDLFDQQGGPSTPAGDIEYVEYADDVPSALVDEDGDDQHARSTTYDAHAGGWRAVSGHGAETGSVRIDEAALRGLLVDEDGEWRDDVSGADVVEALTMLLVAAGLGGRDTADTLAFAAPLAGAPQNADAVQAFTDQLSADAQISMEERIASDIFADCADQHGRVDEEVCAELARKILRTVLTTFRPDLVAQP